MYEIWLVINTFYELTLANLGLVLGTLIAWLALMLLTQFKKDLPWSKGVKPALLVAVVFWMIFFVALPGLTKSSFASVISILDWLTVAGVAAGFAGLLALFVGPLYLLAKR